MLRQSSSLELFGKVVAFNVIDMILIFSADKDHQIVMTIYRRLVINGQRHSEDIEPIRGFLFSIFSARSSTLSGLECVYLHPGTTCRIS